MEQPTIAPQPRLQAVVVADDDGNEEVEYRVNDDIVDVATYEAERVRMADAMQSHMMEVSRFMDEQQSEEAADAIEQDIVNADRRAKATAELEALGLSAETIDTIVRGT